MTFVISDDRADLQAPLGGKARALAALRQATLPEFGESYPGAVYLGPRIIAIHSPRIPKRQDLGIACASDG